MSINKTPLKVLQLGSPAGLYGAERWILALVKHLDPDKVTSVIGVIWDEPSQDAKLCSLAEQLGLKTIQFEGQGKINFSVVKALRDYILNNEIAVLHTHFYKTDIIGLLAVWGTNCKIVTTPHGWCGKGNFTLSCYELVDRFSFPFFDSVVPLSDKLMHSLSHIPFLKRKLHLITNGVDISEVTNSDFVVDEIAKSKNLGRFVIGYIGRLTPIKGLKTLIKALVEVEEFEWELFLVGDGEQRSELEEMCNKLGVKGRVKFTGFRHDRLDFLRGFDVFVLPSQSEGIPRCLMEAMAAKVPIVATDIPGCRYVVTHNQTGLLFSVGDETELAFSIRRIAGDEETRKALVEEGSKFVEANYSAARMAKEYTELYYSLNDSGSFGMER